MNLLKTGLTAIIALTLFSFQGKSTDHAVNAAASKIVWKAKKTTGSHEGTVNVQHGVLVMDGDVPLHGEFVMDMTSIAVTDLKDATQNAKLLGHLKSDDFFSVAKYPTSLIVIRKMAKGSAAGTYTATADLTIKGKTNSITFPVKISKRDGGGYTATADITIDRTKWNVMYNSKSILGVSADSFIYDDVNYSVSLVLNK